MISFKLQDRVDEHEQRNRNLCLLMLDVNEKYRNNENTDDLVVAVIYNVFGINITVNNIERSHRLEALNNRRNLRSARINRTPIILRINSFCNSQEVFKAKRSWKGKQVSLPENLSNTAMELTWRRWAFYFRTSLVATLRLVATQTVGSNMILMVVSNAVRARYIVRIRKLTVKSYVWDSKLVSKALPILAHVRELDLATDKLSVLT